MNLTIIEKGQSYTGSFEKGEKLFAVMRRMGLTPFLLCGGRGSCGKCAVLTIKGRLPITKADQAVLPLADLERGVRLGCKVVLSDEVTLQPLWSGEEEMAILADSKGISRPKDDTDRAGQSYKIAIDIGTTTLAFSLLDGEREERHGAVTMLNHQRSFGADVISRIQAAGNGHAEELQRLIRKDLITGIERLLQKSGISISQVQTIGIAGNTTMLHLLRGYSCNGLGNYPFQAVSLEEERGTFWELILGGEDLPPDNEGAARLSHITTVILPGISAYVGADIYAGITYANQKKRGGITLLVDLGTNGEMAIEGKDETEGKQGKENLLVTSTAAGPAFEGGGLSCGTGSIPGAICKVLTETERARILEKEGSSAVSMLFPAMDRRLPLFIGTIGGAKPEGICGTGAIELLAALLELGIVDKTGALLPEYAEDGILLGRTLQGREIVLTQGDIRQLQLAISAVRVGMEILIKEYGSSAEQVDTLFLAGGFGYYLDPAKAGRVGMIPKEYVPKAKALGNTSLAGVEQYIMRKEEDILAFGLGEAREIVLANHPDFEKEYIKHMIFEE